LNPISPSTRGKAFLALLAGLGLTVASTLYIAIDALTTNRLTNHIRDAYPNWSQDDIDADRLAITIYLLGFGVLGAIAWLWCASLVQRGKPSARLAVTVTFIVGTGLAMINATQSGEAYEQIVPTPYGVVGLLPSLAGLAAVWLIWRRGA